MTILEEALKYRLDLEFSVIPVGQNKKPLVKWEPYQHKMAEESEIRQWWQKWPSANVGIVTGAVSNICVIDIDEKEGFEAINDYIPETISIPTTKSPRGGQHLYFRSPNRCPSNNARLIPGCDFRGEGGYIIAPPSVNGTGHAYAWVDGLSIFEVDLPELPLAYISFISSFSTSIYCKDDANVSEMFKRGTRDNDLFHIANQLVKANTKEPVIKQVLKILALSCDPPFELNEIPAKIESAISRSEIRNINLSREVLDWISVTDGDFSVKMCDESLRTASIVTKRDTLRQIFKRLKDDGVIQKAGNADGVYRKVDTEQIEIDFLNAKEEILDLSWPFEIEKWVQIMPKNIVVVAGLPNAGKTAFLLNFCQINMESYPIEYFSSEMGAVELRKRLSKFDLPIEKWKVKFWEKSSNFEAGLKPDGINIIDFLEVYEEFYKVGLFIKQIYDRLNKGVAIIAIQKNPKTDFGLGGMRSLEKARLYISIDNGVIKIVKAKNWACETNPNGIERSFKVIQGAKFKPMTDWERRTH